MHSVAEQADVAVGPLELGRAVEEVALLDLVERGAAQQLFDLCAPPVELVSEEVDLCLAAVEREGVGRQVEEGVPAVTVVRGRS